MGNSIRVLPAAKKDDVELYADRVVAATKNVFGPNLAPLYWPLYTHLASVVRKHGYALAVHGSLSSPAAEFDLICIPWADEAIEPEEVVNSIVEGFHVSEIIGPDTAPHRRQKWTIAFGVGEPAIELSFTPRTLRQVEADGLVKDVGVDPTRSESELVKEALWSAQAVARRDEDEAIAQDIRRGLDSGEISMCACMGPMYGEAHCYCQMKRLGLPLNDEERAVDVARAEKELDALFEDGGLFSNQPGKITSRRV